jgi:hypothetical protein
VFHAGGSVEVSHAGGSVEVSHAGGSTEVSHAGGSVEVSHVDGSTEVSHAGGSVEVSHAGGSVEVSHAGGSVEVFHAGGSVEVFHAGGSVEVLHADAPHVVELHADAPTSICISVGILLPISISCMLTLNKFVKSDVNLFIGIANCLAISTIKSVSNSKFTYVVTLIASTKGNENCGNSKLKKSNGKNPFLSVKNAIWSQALHSGINIEVFKRHITFVISFTISAITSIAASNFGNFGGGGKSGNSIFGKLGRSGNCGILISGRTGIEGKDKVREGTEGKERLGKFGNNIGLGVILNSGKATSSPTLILCKSKIISGHFGN